MGVGRVGSGGVLPMISLGTQFVSQFATGPVSRPFDFDALATQSGLDTGLAAVIDSWTQRVLAGSRKAPPTLSTTPHGDRRPHFITILKEHSPHRNPHRILLVVLTLTLVLAGPVAAQAPQPRTDTPGTDRRSNALFPSRSTNGRRPKARPRRISPWANLELSTAISAPMVKLRCRTWLMGST